MTAKVKDWSKAEINRIEKFLSNLKCMMTVVYDGDGGLCSIPFNRRFNLADAKELIGGTKVFVAGIAIFPKTDELDSVIEMIQEWSGARGRITKIKGHGGCEFLVMSIDEDAESSVELVYIEKGLGY